MKSVATFHKRLIRVSLILLALSILISAIAITQIVKAAGPTLSVTPTAGVAGKLVNIRLDGFGYRTLIIVSLGPTEVLRANTTANGQLATYFSVPDVHYGIYKVTAIERRYDSISRSWVTTANSASAEFNVIPSGSSSGTPTPPSDTSPSDTPVIPVTPSTPSDTSIVGGGGDLGPLAIGLVAVALVAIFVPATAYYLRGKRNREYEYKRPESPYDKPPTPSAPSRYQATTRSDQPSYRSQQLTRPSATTQYRQRPSYSSQPSRPYSTSRYAQPSSYSRPTAGTKICRNCHQAVRDDYNICPYCNKRLR